MTLFSVCLWLYIHCSMYRWGAFVDDTVYEGADGLAAALAAACEEGSVSRAMEVLAHQGDVNGVLPGRGGACPLHVAVKGGFVHLSAYLAVNGADVYDLIVLSSAFYHYTPSNFLSAVLF